MPAPSSPALVIGGINADLKSQTLAPPQLHTSNPAHSRMTPGGVARNVAENLARLAVAVRLLGAVGRDPLGDAVLQQTGAAGVDVSGVLRLSGPTGTYTAVLDHHGELLIGLAAMQLTDQLTPERVGSWRSQVAGAALLVLDANLPSATLLLLLDAARQAGVPALLDPVSAPKAAPLRGQLSGLYLITPDRAELEALTGEPDPDRAARQLLEQGVQHVLLTQGRAGSRLYVHGQPAPLQTGAPEARVRDVTGAGDALLAGLCAGLLRGLALPDALHLGHRCAARTVESEYTVRPDLGSVVR
ncbi:carbohydrate kinase family protein [Deinococcus sonorensis]|uniref:Carbohydrate kinase family protein n=2 Tax=Deinococcus sonorensis TaxID=309891 RepID=A0AAU7UAU9_9DEIO